MTRATYRSKSLSCSAFSNGPALGVRELVCHLNQCLVDTLVGGGASRLVPKGTSTASWCGLSFAARERLIRLPVLILNLRFEDAEWWRLEAQTAAQRREIALVADIPDADIAELSLHVVMLAWHLARCAQTSAFLIGMTPPVGQMLARLNMREVHRIAQGGCAQVRPRWEANELFWPALLKGASDSNEQEWNELQLHSLQLLGFDLLRTEIDSCPKGGRCESV